MPKENSSLSRKFLLMLEPLFAIIPEVPKPPAGSVKIYDKFFWTVIILLLYLTCSQVPIYGIQKMAGDDPLYWTRIILASNRGTLMELGISPIITAGMIMQLLVGAKVIALNMEDEHDKDLFERTNKLMALVIGFMEAVGYVWSGFYGDVAVIGSVNCVLIVLQLTFAAILVTLLDEVMSNGYGMGSAISTFIATNVCEEIVWKTFSPMAYGQEYEGAIINFVYLLVTKPNKLAAIQSAFYRDFAPNINNLLATALVFLVVIALEEFHFAIAIHQSRQRGHTDTHKVKLFYTSNMPIILMSALISNVFWISRAFYQRFGTGDNLMGTAAKWFGTWKESAYGGYQYPVGGMAYYMKSPENLSSLISDPIHGIIYTVFTVSACAVFSKTWTEIGGNDHKKVFRQLKDQGYTAKSAGDGMLERRLKNRITLASSLGGVCVGVLTIAADLLGAIGSGTGILLTCNIIYEFYEAYRYEQKAMGSM